MIIIRFLLLNLMLFFNFYSKSSFEKDNILNLKKYLGLTDKITQNLINISSQSNESKNIIFRSSKSPEIFKKYPNLKEYIPYCELGDWPTSVCKLEEFSHKFNVNLYIKRDDLTGKKISEKSRFFGGNKVRKLEFLLSDAVAKNFDTVLTFGCAGSNHAIATAIYSNILGLKSILMLKPQHNSNIVRRNLLFGLASGAKIIYAPTNELRAAATVYKVFNNKEKTGKMPYVIPTGGSCPLGALGYVNAAFELKSQIDQNIIPSPDKIYLPLGSAGTISGLLLGLKLCDLKIKVYGVTVEPEELEDEFLLKLNSLFQETNTLLNSFDKSIKLVGLNPEDFEIIKNFCGKDYALFTKEAVNSIKILQETENIKLDGVYSGKAFSSIINDIEINNIKKHENILFWNTFYSEDFDGNFNYNSLPKPFYKYFEEDVQDLDKL